MKRFGFRSAFAGGVEATSSMGGQIMPPVMGAVAFIMAETLNVPYAAVVQGGDHPGDPLFRRLLLDGASGGGQGRAGGMNKADAAEPVGRDPPALAAGPAAGGARLAAVRRLHADLRRDDGPGADRRADPRACRSRR